jgi:hypothetical protein
MPHLKATILLLPALLLVAGCVTPGSKKEMRYFPTSPTKTQDDLLKARLQCFNELQKKTPKPECGAVDTCLADRGFLKSETGALQIPEGSTLDCQEPEKK